MNKVIKFVDLPHKYSKFKERFHSDLDDVLNSGQIILGENVELLEQTLANIQNVNSVVTVGNGTDALVLSLRALGIGPGDIVLTTPMSYLASSSSIALVGATIRFVDVDMSLNICPNSFRNSICPDTKAILLVHLAGIPADLKNILNIAKINHIPVIEDCAQAFGAEYLDRKVGGFGDIATLSFHPLKNLGCIGDGGAIFINDKKISSWLKQARNHGHSSRDECEFWSVNSRLDALQAKFILSQLDGYDGELARRRMLASIYYEQLGDIIDFPMVHPNSLPSYNWFMILTDQRDELFSFLVENNIETKIHYPKLISELKAAGKGTDSHSTFSNATRQTKRILSLPNAEHITESDVLYICNVIREFYSE
jgi:dTDP-4-amino-4,6-dideoxygalactose transaminase